MPAWSVRDHRRRPQQRRDGEGQHGGGLHHRAPVGGRGHRDGVGHRRRAQLHPEGRRGHGHRPQDVPGRRGVRRGHEVGTGLVRLPNAGAVKWRKADNSGDLGMALNASNHLAMDAIIDFAAGQTFGAITVPDATTLAKGVVQIDPVGGWRSRPASSRLAGIRRHAWHLHQDHRGREGARHGWRALAAGDLPAHTHVASDIVSGSLPFKIQNNGRGGGHPPRVEPDPGREHRPDVRGRCRQRPGERHRRARLRPGASTPTRGRRDRASSRISRARPRSPTRTPRPISPAS